MQPKHENHLTATLFENFVLFPDARWLARLAVAAGIPPPPNSPLQCNWGYEVVDLPTSKAADVAIHARAGGVDYVILIEAKRKGGALKETDSDPRSYLELNEFSWAGRRYLIYLVDETDLAKTRALVVDPSQRSGFLTWQALGGMQIDLALRLACKPHIRAFIAGAIQFQYLAHRITPTIMAAEYLRDERPASEITKTNPDRMKVWTADWRLDTKKKN
jgi:hypothetical protein